MKHNKIKSTRVILPMIITLGLLGIFALIFSAEEPPISDSSGSHHPSAESSAPREISSPSGLSSSRSSPKENHAVTLTSSQIIQLFGSEELYQEELQALREAIPPADFTQELEAWNQNLLAELADPNLRFTDE